MSFVNCLMHCNNYLSFVIVLHCKIYSKYCCLVTECQQYSFKFRPPPGGRRRTRPPARRRTRPPARRTRPPARRRTRPPSAVPSLSAGRALKRPPPYTKSGGQRMSLPKNRCAQGVGNSPKTRALLS